MRKFQPVTPYKIYWTISFLLHLSIWENSSEYKGLNIGHFIDMFFDWSDHLLFREVLGANQHFSGKSV